LSIYGKESGGSSIGKKVMASRVICACSRYYIKRPGTDGRDGGERACREINADDLFGSIRKSADVRLTIQSSGGGIDLGIVGGSRNRNGGYSPGLRIG
jgi:hypothetical protein